MAWNVGTTITSPFTAIRGIMKYHARRRRRRLLFLTPARTLGKSSHGADAGGATPASMTGAVIGQPLVAHSVPGTAGDHYFATLAGS